MRRMVGLALAGLFVGACGHEVTTGSAKNDWNTPTGYASATNPRVVNPMVQPARDRSYFEQREAPPLQPVPTDTAAPTSTETPPPAGPVAPPAEVMPPPETVPDVMPPDTSPHGSSDVPPYVAPIRP